MRIHERGGRQRGLDQVFIPDEPRRVMPSDISEEIVLTHPALPVGSLVSRLSTSLTAGAAGNPAVNGPQPGDGQLHWIIAAQLSHDDPTDREVRFALEEVLSGRLGTLLTQVAVPAGVEVALPRSLVVPSRFRLVGRADALTAGDILTLVIFFATVREAESFPYL